MPIQPSEHEDADALPSDPYARLVEHNRAAQHVADAGLGALDERMAMWPASLRELIVPI